MVVPGNSVHTATHSKACFLMGVLRCFPFGEGSDLTELIGRKNSGDGFHTLFVRDEESEIQGKKD